MPSLMNMVGTALFGVLWTSDTGTSPQNVSQQELQREVARMKHLKEQAGFRREVARMKQIKLETTNSGGGNRQAPRVTRQVPNSAPARRPQRRVRVNPEPEGVIPWRRIAPRNRAQRTFATDVNSDESWEPFNVSPFANLNIFKQKYSVTMHNTLDCALDTPIRALASRPGGEDWSYRTFRDLQRQVNKLREIVGSTPAPGQRREFCEVCGPEVIRRFQRKRIGIVLMRNDESGITARGYGGGGGFMNAGVSLYVTAHDEQPVDCYFMWSTTAALSDALALRVNKDQYKVLLTREEMSSIYERAYPQRSPEQKLLLEEIRQGKRLPGALKMRIRDSR